jgi:PAS domain S-box-containing protein
MHSFTGLLAGDHLALGSSFWRRRAPAIALGSSIALTAITLVVNTYGPRLAPMLLPILLLALGLGLLNATQSLSNIRREHSGADEAFRNTEREFSSIFDNVLDGILILDSEATCLDGNPAVTQILRVPKCRLIGRNLNAFFVHSSGFTSEWNSFLQRKNHRGRAALVAGDGTPVFVDFTAAMNYLPGRHIFILCDVTERTRAEKSLRSSEERFRHMADNIQEIFWMMNATTQEVTYVNRAYATITGHTVQSLQANPSSYQELIHPEDRVRVLSRLREIVDSGTFDEEFRFTRADGTVRWIWAKGFPVPSDAETRWLVGTAQDITSRKLAEMKISEQLDAVEAARSEAEALRKSTLALSQNLAMDSVLDTLLQCISELVPFDSAAVLFAEEGFDLMVAREAPHTLHTRAGFTLKACEDAFLGKVLFEKRAMLVRDVSEETEWRGTVPLEHLQSWVGVPLIAAERVLGILSLGSNERRRFNTEHLRLAKSLAVSAAVAIQNARTHERAEIYAAELELRLEELRDAQKALQHASGKQGASEQS